MYESGSCVHRPCDARRVHRICESAAMAVPCPNATDSTMYTMFLASGAIQCSRLVYTGMDLNVTYGHTRD